MPLVWGFDSLKTLYGLFVERQIRKYLLYMHDFCSILLYETYIISLARQSCYAAAIFPAPALDAIAVGAVDSAVPFAVFVDIAIFLIVTIPQ